MAGSRNVTVIPATVKMHTGMPVNMAAKKRVAGYARVSTDSDEQFTSYEAQIDYYTKMIKSHNDWEFVEVYTDEGISGTNTKKRNGFNRMIGDALAGKIDLIVTKSVSRFARNTVDSLVTVRKLKEKGVEVFFEKENIYTLDSKGELLITIMSSLAQEESRSLSENVTWGMRKRFSDGKVSMPYKRFLGYKKGPDGQPEIDEEEAKVVREIYDLFLSGETYQSIAKILTGRKIPTPTGKANWRSSTVFSILQNEKYKGAALLQKKFTTDFLTKKTKVNEGEIPQYYVENSHPAIIDPRLWELTQIEIARRSANGRGNSGCNIFSSRLVCAECGSFYNHKSWNNKKTGRKTVWHCNRKYYKDRSCDSKVIPEEQIKEKFISVFNEIFDERDFILETCRDVLEHFEDTVDLDEKIDDHIRECEIIEEMNRRLVEENSRSAMDQDVFMKKYNAYVDKYEKESAEIEKLHKLREEQVRKAEQISAFMFEIHERDGLLEEFDEKLWLATIDKVLIQHDGRMVFKFRNGTEVTR